MDLASVALSPSPAVEAYLPLPRKGPVQVVDVPVADYSQLPLLEYARERGGLFL